MEVWIQKAREKYNVLTVFVYKQKMGLQIILPDLETLLVK